MKPSMMIQRIWPLVICFATAFNPGSPAVAADTRDVAWFLRRLRTLDHLPELENSHTAMASTWDRSGGNNDGTDFKDVRTGGTNVLLDVEGPGCLHRVFVGVLTPKQAATRVQVLLDRRAEPVFDLPLLEFFDDEKGPFPYPLVFHKSYPGLLFPIPYAQHCRVQLVNPRHGQRRVFQQRLVPVRPQGRVGLRDAPS